MSKLIDYIISLTNLYGIVYKDKVVEIYNMQNEEEISEIGNVDIDELNKTLYIIMGIISFMNQLLNQKILTTS